MSRRHERPEVGTVVTHRRYVPYSHAHYAGNLVDGAYSLAAFGDVATEMCIRTDGDEGLFASYADVQFRAPVRAGDVIEIECRLVRVGRRSREMEFEVRVVARGTGSDAQPGAAAVLRPAAASATTRPPRHLRRSVKRNGLVQGTGGPRPAAAGCGYAAERLAERRPPVAGPAGPGPPRRVPGLPRRLGRRTTSWTTPPQGGGHVLEGFSVLAALAAVVPRVRLGSLVAGNLYRHPAVLANQAATIDVISDGRFVLGLGAGWQENEHAQYGIDLLTTGPRLRRFEEACEVIRALRDERVATFDGELLPAAGRRDGAQAGRADAAAHRRSGGEGHARDRRPPGRRVERLGHAGGLRRTRAP